MLNSIHTKSVSQSSMIVVMMMTVLMSLMSFVQAEEGRLSDDIHSRLSTIPHNAALQKDLLSSGLPKIAVRHEGWNETLQSWSIIKINELTGRRSIHGQDPVYTVLSLMYEQEKWFDAKMFPVEHPRINEVLGTEGKWISAKDFIESGKAETLQLQLTTMFAKEDRLREMIEVLNAAKQASMYDSNNSEVMMSLVPDGMDEISFSKLVNDNETLEKKEQEYQELRTVVKNELPFRTAGTKLIERWQLASHLREQFLIVPDIESLDGSWIAADETKPARTQAAAGSKMIQSVSNSGLRESNLTLQRAAYQLDQKLLSAFATQSADNFKTYVADFLNAVTTAEVYPAGDYRQLKNFYTGFNPNQKAAYLHGLSAIIFGLFIFFRKKGFRIAGVSLLCVGFGLQTIGMLSRLILTGNMPVSNMYESITFTAWCAVLIGVIFEFIKRKSVFGLSTAVVGFLMLMAVHQMPLYEMRIHPLRAVLNSYWLNIHVTAMLISYGAFMVASIFAVIYFIKAGLVRLTGRESLRKGTEPLMDMAQTELFMYRLIQVGWPILTVGVCLGAVWADTAWGRYWGWDPKETWALITWIVYTIYLHSRMVMGWKGKVSVIFAFVGFVMVMITWLGVSYLPWFAGGLHTYASPI